MEHHFFKLPKKLLLEMDKSFGHIGYSQNDNKKDNNQSGQVQINVSKNALWSKIPIQKIAFFCNE